MDVLTRATLDPAAPLAAVPRPACIIPGESARASPAQPLASTPTGDAQRGPDGATAETLTRWFHEHGEGLWRLVVRLGVPGHSADDIVQEAFIVASRRSADIALGQERRFLVGTAIRLCSNFRQRAHVRREIGGSHAFDAAISPAPDAEQLLIERRWRERLERVLSELRDTHREPFVLYELEGFSVPEIAELLGLPLGTVSSRLWRARARFSELVTALYGSSFSEDER